MRVLITLLTAGLALQLHGCGGDGDAMSTSSETKSDLFSGLQDWTGSLTSQSGGQSIMAGWIVALIERDRQIAKVAEADSVGLLKFSQVNKDAYHTAVLFSPDYILAGVLALPSSTANTVRHFFKSSSGILPRLIHKGTVITFQAVDNLTVHKDTASDSDGNGIPDGAAFSLTDIPKVDTDQDGIYNEVDPDMDGDGLVNIIDSDEDADGSIDVVDVDANGDIIPDATQKLGDNYFSAGIEYFSVQYQISNQTDGTTENSILFTSKLQAGISPNKVQIRGPAGLLNGATILQEDESGNETPAAWDKTLADDGHSEDAAPGDGLYARKIYLASGTAPKSNQAIFLQLGFGTSEKPWYVEYPYLFPPVTIGTFTGLYDTTTRKVQYVGEPFGTLKDFTWSVIVYDEKGVQKVHESGATAGTTTTVTLPSNIFTTGNTYKYRLVAQLLDRVPGYPSYLVQSIPYELKP